MYVCMYASDIAPTLRHYAKIASKISTITLGRSLGLGQDYHHADHTQSHLSNMTLRIFRARPGI